MRTILLAAFCAAAPLSAQQPAPAQRLAAAQRVVARLMPPGTYRRMMQGTMQQMSGSIVDQVTAMPLRSLAGVGGVPADQVAKMGPATMKEVAVILDPAFEERMRRTTEVMMTGMVDVMEQLEPTIREGLAEAYATRFSDAQLADVERFFATPSGSAFAANNLTIMADPAMVKRMQAMMPELTRAMPALMGKAQAATADLPAPRKPSELSAEDRSKLARLLGVDAATLTPPAPANR